MLIAQISDLHIRPPGEKLYDSIDTNGLCARHVAYLNALEQRPDAVVVTGDIVNCGQPAEYAMARRILNALDYPVYLLPGNHDDNRSFLDAFAEDHPYLGSDAALICYAVEHLPLRLVFVDSSVDGELHGHLGEQRLTRLAEVLGQRPNRQTVLFMHHHPLPSGCLHMDTIRCRDGEALVELISLFPAVTRVFCGHTHRAIFQQLGSLLIGTAPAAVHQVPYNTVDPDGFYSLEPPAMLMHRFHPQTGFVSYVASLAPFDGPFRFACTIGCPETATKGA